MGVLATIRQSFSDATWYRIAWERYTQTPDALERPRFDESLAALGAAAHNEQQVVFSAWSDNAIVRTLALADELSIDAIVSGAIDGWRVADELAESGLPVLVSLDHRPRRDPVGFGRQAPGGLMVSPGADDKKDAEANAARLHRAGVQIRVHFRRTRIDRQISPQSARRGEGRTPRTSGTRSPDGDARNISRSGRESGNARSREGGSCRRGRR